MPIYPFKTTPYAHQREAFLRSKDRSHFALLMEQRTGKSKVFIDTACYQFAQGNINAALVIAPNGVHNSWHRKQWPDHAWDSVTIVSAAWSSSPNKTERAELDALFDLYDYPVLRVLHVNVEALSRKGKARDNVKRFLDCFDVMTAVDESTTIKNPAAQRTKAIWYIGKRSKMSRILTGTPATKSPLDVFAQFKFMDPHLLGYESYYAFRSRYAIMRQRNIPGRPSFTEVVGYQNEDELAEKVREHSYRVTKDECFDLPERTTVQLPVELSKKQREIYDRIRKEALINLSGDDVSIPHVLTQLIRCQQVIGGFVPPDTGQKTVPVQKERVPKMQRLLDDIEQIDSKALIWSRFTAEIDAIVKELRAVYGPDSTLRYDGSVKAKDRPEVETRFQTDPGTRFLVLQPQSGARGLELYAASYVYWYSASHSLEEYLQANERPHSQKQTKNVAHVHLCAQNTLDEKIINTLEQNKEIADLITGDDPKKLFR